MQKNNNSFLDSLKMLSEEDLSLVFNVGRHSIQMWRECKLIIPIKTGKNYMYSVDEVKRIQSQYRGMDLSNKVQILKAMNERIGSTQLWAIELSKLKEK